MKAVWYERTGPAREVLQFGEVPTPTPGRGQVLIRIHASGVNPSDAGMRAGPAPMAFPRIIPNSDGAGVVEAVGPETPARWLGRRVWFYNGQRNGRAFGSAAEYIELDADLVTPLPDGVKFAQGATLGIPCMTAHRSVFVAGPVQGRTVLVTGGAGVDHVVDVDFGGNLPVTLACMKGNGSVAFYATKGEPTPKVPAGELMRLNLNVHGVYLPVSPHEARRRAQADILQWISTGARILPVAGRHSLADCAAAHEQVESGTKAGTVVVEPFGP